MSEIKLNIIDNQQVLSGTIHGSVADACVAALSAEPETSAELVAALARYIKPLDARSPFAGFLSSTSDAENLPLDAVPWDAGLVIIDLAARIVAAESTYSSPEPSGEICYHDGTAATDIPIRYRLPDDWLFVNSVEAYRWSRERRRAERKKPIDARKVLYGAPLLEFIGEAVGKVEMPDALIGGRDDSPPETLETSESPEAQLARILSGIHACWLTTARDDLGGDSPRDVMLEKQDLIDFDLQWRSLQWSFLDEGPPCLSPNSFAYRFAGFGTHEWVIYYDLVRHLLWSALSCRSRGRGTLAPHAGRETPNANREELLAQLEQIKSAWLEQPQEDYDGRIPAILIDNERKRLPIVLRRRDMIIDEDCPICQMFGDETSPLGIGVGFWHLDGSSMDDDFASSFYKTRGEWEAENQRREQFSKEFDRRWEERRQRIARGEVLEHDPFFDSDPFPGLEFEDSRLLADESSEDKDVHH